MDNINPRILAEQLIAERPVEIKMEGVSMYPTLRADDRAIVQKCEDFTKIKRGDLVAFRSSDNNLVCHRVIKIKSTDKDRIFTTKGDNNYFLDQSFAADQIFGIITSYKHNNKEKSINSLRMKFLRFAFLYFSRFAQKGFALINNIR
jgi:signal peptidase I, archaeal type